MSHQNKKYRRGLGHRLEMTAALTLITAILMMQPSAIEAKAVRGETDLFGPVRSVIYKEGAWNSGIWADGATISQMNVTYDAEGHTIESEEFQYRDKQIVPSSKKRSVYRYDEKSNTEEVLSYTEGGSWISKEVLTFDGKGRITEVVSYNQEGPRSKRGYRYDNTGNRTEIISYKKTDDFVSMRMRHFREKAGTDSVAYDDDFETDSKTETISDKETDDFVSMRMRHFREKAGTDSVSYADDFEIEFRIVNRYDEQNHLIEALTYKADGSIAYKWMFKYDTGGQKVRVSVYDTKGTILFTEAYSYKYDSEGNWTERVVSGWEFGKGSHDRIKIRTIEYY